MAAGFPTSVVVQNVPHNQCTKLHDGSDLGHQLGVSDATFPDPRPTPKAASPGPTSAALWLLTSLLIDPDAELLAPGSLCGHIAKAGFADVRNQEVIPTITRMIAATKSD